MGLCAQGHASYSHRTCRLALLRRSAPSPQAAPEQESLGRRSFGCAFPYDRPSEPREFDPWQMDGRGVQK
jgi:hypothetical protein